MALLFGIGYAGIIFEESLAFNKSGVGLLMAVSLWVVRSIGVIFFPFLVIGNNKLSATKYAIPSPVIYVFLAIRLSIS